MNRLKMSAAFAAALQVLFCATQASTAVREPRSFADLPDAESWQSMSVVPFEITVSMNSEIDWNLKLPENVALLADDCIEFTFVSPYEDARTYQSFNLDDTVACDYSLGPKDATCSIVDQYTLRITFSHDAREDVQGSRLKGRTLNSVYSNPFSARQLRQVEAALYPMCNTDRDPTVFGTQEVSASQSALILTDSNHQALRFDTDSLVIGLTDATLTISFFPATKFKKGGVVVVKVPSWYNATDRQKSVEAMLGFNSVASFVSPAGFRVTSREFDAATQTLSFQYEGDEDQHNDSQIIIEIDNFKNPVNLHRRTGFQLTTQDLDGFIIDQSYEDLPLSQKMTVISNFQSGEIYLLGNAYGENAGRIDQYNSIQVALSSSVPFELYCYFKFTFPDQLRLDGQLLAMYGDGFFTSNRRTSDNSLSSGLYEVDLNDNSVKVKGCNSLPFLGSNPSGSVTFDFIKLPSYIERTEPILVTAYSDERMNYPIMSTQDSLFVDKEDLKPGLLALEFFKPSSYFAWTPDVSYTIHIRPSHDLTFDAKIIVTMPENLTFNPADGCTVSLIAGDCRIIQTALDFHNLGFGRVRNEIEITNWLNGPYEGGNLIKFVISYGKNPTGARSAGPWGVRTENRIGREYFPIDADPSYDSFFALTGSIVTELVKTSSVTYDVSDYRLTMYPEHGLVRGGFFTVRLPEGTRFTDNNKFSEQRQATQSDLFSIFDSTFNEITLEVMREYEIKEPPEPIIISLLNVRNPRSFMPSQTFQIKTLDPDLFEIDVGGQDINLIMHTQNFFDSFTITPSSVVNGEHNTYTINFNTLIPLEEGDLLNIIFPNTVDVTGEVTCIPAEGATDGIVAVTCRIIGTKLIATIHTLGETRDGDMQFFITGVRNPPSSKPSDPFWDIHMTNSLFFDIQKVEDLGQIYIQNQETARILDFDQIQTREDYAQISSYTIIFTPENEIDKLGSMTLTYTDQVELTDSTECIVTTYKKFTDTESVCEIDRQNRMVIIDRAFIDTLSYEDQISIQLTEVQNPRKNADLQFLKIETFLDKNRLYPIDILEFRPQLTCNYPCKFCTDNKDLCTVCWEDDEQPYLMLTTDQKTCKAHCDEGWTSNGNPELVCQRCDHSCQTCRDEGEEGDLLKCGECSEDYAFYQTMPGYSRCYLECPAHTFDIGGGECGACDPSCLYCTGPSADECLACDSLNLEFRVREGDRCVAECSEFYAEVGDTCLPCKSPCKTCEYQDYACTSCDGRDGAIFLYGPQCLADCPAGTEVNRELNICEGCMEGCLECGEENQSECLLCEDGFLLFEGICSTSCPAGYMSNFMGDECLNMEEMDMKQLYFPFIIAAVIALGISGVGVIMKPRHILITNWLIMLGLLEHVLIFTQVLLTFAYGTLYFAVVSIVLWLVFISLNIAFYCMFQKQVKQTDDTYKKWANKPTNRCGSCMNEYSSAIFSWLFIKLYYSHFVGSPQKFSAAFNPNGTRAYIKVQQKMVYASCVYYGLVFACGCAGVGVFPWGTQLPITYLEQVLYSVLILCLLFWEQRKIKGYMEEDLRVRQSKEEGMKFMSRLEEEDDPTKEKMMLKLGQTPEFLNQKLEDLLIKFGERKCVSCEEFGNDLVKDQRLVKSYHDPKDEYKGRIEDPPRPFYIDPYPNNVIGIPTDACNLKRFEAPFTDCTNKGIQVGGQFAGDMLRMDASVVTRPTEPMVPPVKKKGRGDGLDLDESFQKSAKKKQRRGRKNRFFQQIDHEDNDAGVLLDSDSEGERANQTAKNLMIDQQRNLDAQREEREEAERKNLAQLMDEKKQAEKRVAEEAEQTRRRQIRDAEQAEQMRKDAAEAKLVQKGAEEEAEQSRVRQAKEAEVRRKKEEALASDIEKLKTESKPSTPVQSAPRTASVASVNDRASTTPALQQSQPDAGAKPDAELRNFNEIDIVGELERDDKGNLIVEFGNDHDMAKEVYYDLNGEPISIRGYRVDPSSGSIIHNRTGLPFFSAGELDSRGSLPAPFCIEKFNFCPFELQGTFQFTDKDDPGSFQKAYKAGRFLDKDEKHVTMQGFLTDKDGSLINRDGVKRFDWRQFTQFGGLVPKLYTYTGKRFDIHEVMGVFERKQNGALDIHSTHDAEGNSVAIDMGGHPVNSRGYLINERGDVCSRIGHVLFPKEQLKNDDFPKFFPFTRFNLRSVLGDFDMDPSGNPILDRQTNGDLNDKQMRRVNAKGYLVDTLGNVVDLEGRLVFERHLLDGPDGDIPELFRMNLLRSESDSSISQLMSDLEKNQPFEEEDEAAIQMGRASAMEAKKAAMAARMSDSNDSEAIHHSASATRQMRSRGPPQEILEEDEYYDEIKQGGKKTRKKKKKKQPKDQYFVEEVTRKDHDMANAYGGVAKPRIRKVPGGIKLRSMNRERERERSAVRASSQGKPVPPQMGNLFGSTRQSQGQYPNQESIRGAGQSIATNEEGERMAVTQQTGWQSNQDLNRAQQRPPYGKQGAQDPRQVSGMAHTHTGGQVRGMNYDSSRTRGVKTSGGGHAVQGTGSLATHNQAAVQFEDEFEKLYKDDIQKFIDESSFEVASLEGLSQLSKDSQRGPSKTKNLEKVYLQRVEGMGPAPERPLQPQKEKGIRVKKNFVGEDSIARGTQGNGINSTKNTDVANMGLDPSQFSQHTPLISSSEMPLQSQGHASNPFKDLPGNKPAGGQQ